MNSPSPSPNPPPYLLNHHHHHHHNNSSIATDIIIAAASLALLALVLLLLFFLCKNKKQNNHHTAIDPDDDTISAVSILHASSHPLTHLDAATDGFHPSLIIGNGPLGTVYSTTSITGNLFAIKRIHSHLILGNPGLDFSSKLKSLSFTNHPNVLPILGYSEAPGERIIITELARSLEFYLHGETVGVALDWGARLRIAAGAARGIEHLHGGGIVHGRVKASNILVDVKNNYVARVCDYGLSFLGQDYKRGGVDGCMDDVYGFGVVLLEMLSGRSDEGGLVVEWGLGLIRMGRVGEVLDERVGLPTDTEGRALVRMAKVASTCIGNGRRSRPSIGQVAVILSSLEMEVCV